MLQEVPGDGNASENKFLEARMRCQSSRPLSATGPSGEEFDTEVLYSARLAAAATDMRQFVEAMWKSELGLGPFANVAEDINVKMEVPSKPAEEIEEEGTEGVDLYRDSFTLAYGTFTPVRATKIYLEPNGITVYWGRTSAVRRR